MPTVTFEPLESRRLLSVSFSESEPNNTRAKADELPRILEKTLEVRGNIATTADHDWFKIKLQAGDVLGVAVTGALPDTGGLDPYARLVDSSGKLVIENTGPNFQPGDFLPADSPLPRADRTNLSVEFYRVIAKAGTYFLDVSSYGGESSGTYRADVMVARPGMEHERIGKKQILFLDFDGATVDYSEFVTGQPVDGSVTLSPMVDFLPGFNLSAADEDEVIDTVIALFEKLLVGDSERRGANGDYDRTHNPGDFDIEIRNSRDDADTYGTDPLVSRVVIGGTNEEAGFVGEEWSINGLASTTDVGNFKTDDQAIATLQWITDAVGAVSAQAPVTQAELFGSSAAYLAIHEAGHIFGNFHTAQPPDFFGGTPNLMDPGIGAAIGPDFVMGSDDDIDVRFGVDAYAEEFYAGVTDTLNTLAFGLSTGTSRRGSHRDADNRRSKGGAFAGNGHGSSSAWKRLESMGDAAMTRWA